MTNRERTRSCAFAVPLIRLFLWTLISQIQNQYGCCFIFRLEKDAHTHQNSRYSITTLSGKTAVWPTKTLRNSLCQKNSFRQYFRQKFLCDLNWWWVSPLIKRTLSFRVYDAPMLHHGLNIIVKHMVALWWTSFLTPLSPSRSVWRRTSTIKHFPS